MATGFNPSDEQHQGGGFLKEPGRYVMHVVEFSRYTTQKGDAAIITQCEVLTGDSKGAKVSRMFMLTGGGTRWFADLLKAVNVEYLEDIYNDLDVSRAIGNRPFAADCGWGEKMRNSEKRFMEMTEIFPIDPPERSELQVSGYRAGVNASICVEKKQKSSSGPRDDVPHPAEGADDGPQPASNYQPPDDDIPF